MTQLIFISFLNITKTCHFSMRCFNLHTAQQSLFSPLHHVYSRCSNWFGKSFAKEREKVKKKLVPATRKIQTQQCDRAPIKRLSLHWQQHPFKPLLTTLLFQSVSLKAQSVSICLPLDETSSAHAIQTQMKKSSYNSFLNP